VGRKERWDGGGKTDGVACRFSIDVSGGNVTVVDNVDEFYERPIKDLVSRAGGTISCAPHYGVPLTTEYSC
jgi:hypothetical protein